MNSELNVSVVISMPYIHEMLYVIEQLSQHFNVTVHARDDLGLKPFINPGISYKLYSEANHSPGFLLGLEDELLSSDLVVTYSTVSLASFQALRAIRKAGIPLVTFVKEYSDEPYATFTNVRAIQYDLERSSSRLITFDKRGYANLRSHGVDSERIISIKPMSDASMFTVDLNARRKFRSYVGLDERDFVILWKGDMDKKDSAIAWIETIAALKKDQDLARNPKLVLVGQGPVAHELKYVCHESKVGDLTYFLQQDTQPFAKDLYNAADLIGTHGNHHYADYPYYLLDAALCGCVPVVVQGSLADEITSGFGVRFDSRSDESQFMLTKKVMQETTCKTNNREIVRERCLDSIEMNHSIIKVIETIVDLTKSRSSTRQSENQIQKTRLAELKQKMDSGKDIDALIDIEELLLYASVAEVRSELLAFKGQILLKQDNFDEAFAALSEAHSLMRTNSDALRGLGYLAWKNHSHEEAMIFFRRCLAVNSNDAEAMYGIALIYRRLGLADEALFWLKKRCSIGEITPSVVTAVIQASKECSNANQAIKALEYIYECIGKHSGIITALGNLYLQIGQVEKGQALLDSLFEPGENKLGLAN